jgi:DNA polymerase
VTLDFETYFDKEYSLSRMTTESYVRDPRFRVHGVAIRLPGEQAKWLHVGQLEDIFDIVWGDVAILCHHAQFDGLILAHHYGIRPRMWLDTMAMGRLLLGSDVSVSLDNLAARFGLGAKTVPYDLMKGKTWEEMDDALRYQVSAGAIQDISITWDLFCRLSPHVPAEEFALVDQTVRMFTEPVLVGDTAGLARQHAAELERKEKLLGELGVTVQQLRSDALFGTLLQAEGVKIEYKEGKNGPIPAFAKTDEFMRDLQEDERPRVAALAQARLAQSSAIVETRCARLRAMSTRGSMCVYLNYCGTHTKRFSGGDKLNWQNFPRTSDLGTAIGAPPGFLVGAADASQIECRILNQLAGQTDVLERFRNNEDPYVGIATQFYGEQIYKAKDGDPRKAEMDAKRGTGKQLELSCGYGAGAATIVATARKGTYGPPVFLDDEQGLQARDLYRTTHQAVVGLWREAGDILSMLSNGMAYNWRNVLQVADQRIWLPNGIALNYQTLERNESPERSAHAGAWSSGEWQVRIRKSHGGVGTAKMYGAKLVENVVQALARVHTTQAWVRCAQAGMRMVSMEHDKLIFVAPESEAQEQLKYLQQEMCRPPTWMPTLPLATEGYLSRTLKHG